MERGLSNQAWLMTAPGSAAIAVVRIVGANVAAFLGDTFSGTAKIGRCVHGELRDPASQTPIDDPVVILIDPRRADLCLHGGAWVVQAALDLLRRKGFEIHGKPALPLDDLLLDGADTACLGRVMSYLPLARTELALRMLLAQPAAWKSGRRPASGDRSLHWLLHPPQVAIVGIPNSGKSTLANHLFAQQRAITADLPGTTRDWIAEPANIDGLAVTLVDTPGLRQADDPIESRAIALAQPAIAGSDLVVVLLDVTVPLSGAQEQLLRRFASPLIVANKCDRPKSWDPAAAGAMEIAALSGAGVDGLRHAIFQLFVQDAGDLARPRVIE